MRRDKVTLTMDAIDYGNRMAVTVQSQLLDLLHQRDKQIDQLEAKMRTITAEQKRQLFSKGRKRK